MPTHTVINQVPPLVGHNLYTQDPVLQQTLARFGGGWRADVLSELGEVLGSAEARQYALDANQIEPVIQTHDRFGNRVNQVRFHAGYHWFMDLSLRMRNHCLPWVEDQVGVMPARCAATYLVSQLEPGHGCPVTMTFAVVPAMRWEPEVAAEWEPRVTHAGYDSRDVPAAAKGSCTMGMAMTEKQGGSDVRANSTVAEPTEDDGVYLLTGHKWFCSAPMCDAFLTLAQAPEGLTCFLVPRWRPDGTRNAMNLVRLKNKLGNRSNGSSEIEYERAWSRRVGPPGRGVRTIIDMVQHTRLDCIFGSASLMRQALTQAVHHTHYRQAFGKRLIDWPLMVQVLGDLALESEAALVLGMRLARAFENGKDDPAELALARLATACGKYWVCKRAPGYTFEAMECLGGNGYVEDSGMPLLYREAPVNSIWEGSGNVMCMDVLRALQKEPASVEAVLQELGRAQGLHPDFDAHLRRIDSLLADPHHLHVQARQLVEGLATGLQASLLLTSDTPWVGEAFVAARLGPDRGRQYGALPHGVDGAALVSRAWQSA